MPHGELIVTLCSTQNHSTKDQLSDSPRNFSLPLTLPNPFNHISISRITNEALSRRLNNPSFLDKDFSSKCNIQETSFQHVHTGASHHVSIKTHSQTKMTVHSRKVSSCSDLEPNIATLRYTSAEEGSGEVLYDAGDGNTNSEAKELHDKSISPSVPKLSMPWKKRLQPLPSREEPVPKGTPVPDYSAANNKQQPEPSVVESDIKGAMKRHSHAGFSYQNFHQNEVASDRISKAPKLALVGGTRPISSMSQMPPMPKSLSLDRIPSLRRMYSSDSTPGMLNYKSSNRPQITGAESLRKRDELSGAFRSLEGEFHK